MCIVETNGMTVKLDTTGMLEGLLNVTSNRNRIIGQNLANNNTPGYHRMDVNFGEALTEEMAAARSGARRNAKAGVLEVEGLPERADGNNVDMDTELGEMNRNALMYQTWLQLLGSRLRMMRTAITGQ